MESLQIEEFAGKFQEIEKEIQKSIIGQQEIIRNVLVSAIAGGNVLLEGLPGLGKTQLVKTVGKVLDLKFQRIQFTPDLMPADVTGTNIMVKGTDGNARFQFEEGPIFSNIVLADEINRATPKTQSALLEAMQEKTVTVGRNTYPLPRPYFVLATQNPLEMDGTYPLPEAQMDRFLMKLDVKFPSKEELFDIVLQTTASKQEEPKTVCDGETLLAMGRIAQEVPVSKPVMDRVMELVVKSHPDYDAAPEEVKKYVRYGASPRAAQAIIQCSRIYALIAGRYNVSYEDVREAAPHALRHRLFLGFEASADGITAEDIIQILMDGEN